MPPKLQRQRLQNKRRKEKRRGLWKRPSDHPLERPHVKRQKSGTIYLFYYTLLYNVSNVSIVSTLTNCISIGPHTGAHTGGQSVNMKAIVEAGLKKYYKLDCTTKALEIIESRYIYIYECFFLK
jgi:hypothetical protein